MKKLLFSLLFLPAWVWGAYQPITGSTITVIPPQGGAMPVSGTVSTTGSTVTIVTPQGTKLLVTPDSVALPANQSVNVNQVGGSNLAVSGTAGQQRISAEISGTSNTVVLGAGSAAVGTVNLGIASGFTQIIVGVSTVTAGYGNVITSVPVSIQNATLSVFGSTLTVIPPQGGSMPISGTINVTNLYSGTTAQVLNSTIAVHGYLADNGIAAIGNRIGTLSGITQTDYENGTASTQGRDSAQSHGTDGNLWTAHNPSMRPTWFSASTNTFTLASVPTDVAALCGNASNTVLVTGLRVSCTQTTAGIINLSVLKRSTKFTGAWSTMTVASGNSNYVTTNSTAVFFTANPTVGTLVAQIDNQKLGCLAPATAAPNDIYISPANWRDRALALNGAAECLTVNLGGITATGGALAVSWDWIETKTINPGP